MKPEAKEDGGTRGKCHAEADIYAVKYGVLRYYNLFPVAGWAIEAWQPLHSNDVSTMSLHSTDERCSFCTQPGSVLVSLRSMRLL